jgi:hypothetical protein
VKKILPILLVIGLVVGSFVFWPGISRAADCSVGISPQNVLKGSNTQTVIRVSNSSSSATYKWVKIISQSGNLSLAALSAEGWSTAEGSTESTFYNETGIGPGLSQDFNVEVSTEDVEDTMNLGINISESPAGIDPVSCGTVTVTSVVVVQTTPVVSNISLSVGSGSAAVTWDTDIITNSRVDYGITDAYGSTVTGADYVNNHSLTMGSLSASTTYHYKLTSVGTAGGSFATSDGTFTTSPPGATTTVTTTVTTTTTKTETKMISDTVPPSVSLSLEFDKVYMVSPEMNGKASDNKGVSYLEYSFDDGVNWLPIDMGSSIGQKSVAFSFTPSISDDGNYFLQVRAIDGSGNKGTSVSYTLIIDRLPPLVGGSLISLGPLNLIPNKEGLIVTLAGLDQKLTLSAVGGPIQIDLFDKDKTSSLDKSSETGLWSKIINFSSLGVHQLRIKAIDGAENQTERTIGQILVVKPGEIVNKNTREPVHKAKISLYVLDEFSDTWVLWDAKTFGQDNPQVTSDDGVYRYFLPAGTYYYKISAPGYSSQVSKIFKVSETTPINNIFELTPLFSIGFGDITIIFPDFFADKVDIKINTPDIMPTTSQEYLLTGQVPLFSLPSTAGEFDSVSLMGRSSLISFVNTWSPLSLDQIVILNSLDAQKYRYAVVIPQESVSKVTIFQKRGDYTFPIIIDADGLLIEKFNLHSLPTHYFLDRKGVIKKTIVGVLKREEIEAIFNE